MNPLDLLRRRKGSQAGLRAGSSHSMSTEINAMMHRIPENNPDPGQIATSQNVCNVCIELIKRLSSLPSYTQLPPGIHTIGKLSPTSDCTIHPKLLEGFFPERSRLNCELVSDNEEPDLCIIFHPQVAYKFYFNLVKQSVGGSNIGHGHDNNPSWIDSNVLRQWKDRCCTTHDSKCGQTLASERLPASRAVWLVDTHMYCLVPLQPGHQYVALSYIWGTERMLMTQRDNLTELQKEHALSTGPLSDQVARTIRDSIELVKLLGERYLWVDALCIVQDDGASKHHQITNMSSIYAAAKLSKGHAFSDLGEEYDFINVLWVEWTHGVAYRKGLGRIFQHVWEKQPLEDIELILG